MKLFKQVKRAVKNFMAPSVKEVLRDFDGLRGKLAVIADNAREEAAAIKVDVDKMFDKIEKLKTRGVEQLDEAARANRVAGRINDLLK